MRLINVSNFDMRFYTDSRFFVSRIYMKFPNGHSHSNRLALYGETTLHLSDDNSDVPGRDTII